MTETIVAAAAVMVIVMFTVAVVVALYEKQKVNRTYTGSISPLRCASCHERLFFIFADGVSECARCGSRGVEPMPEATP